MKHKCNVYEWQIMQSPVGRYIVQEPTETAETTEMLARDVKTGVAKWRVTCSHYGGDMGGISRSSGDSTRLQANMALGTFLMEKF